MPYIFIKSIQNGNTLYEGDFTTVKACIERAVAEGVNLSHADLSYQNLAHANLDEAQLSGANFKCANLIGANLSEAMLDNADFTQCSLESTCFAFSSLKRANFTGSKFGGTYIEGATIDGAFFSGQSCFHLDFIQTHSMESCLYTDENNHQYIFSAPPLMIHGLPKTCVIIGNHIKIGTQTYTATLSETRPALAKLKAA